MTSELPDTSSIREFAGEYQLKLIATSGAKSGSVVEGTLKLVPQSPDLRYRTLPGAGVADSSVVHPLYGAADIDLSRLDAVQVGSTTTLDPVQPGVLVLERHARPNRPRSTEIVLRLGSEANRRDRQRVDGGYMALRVLQLTPTGFSGNWSSGIMRERSAGHFCAVRAGGR
ncbi:MAG TPA: hypothetical protein VJ808_02430 [Gemmatimonadales bacterium]|nr:hypothetical protein [Gemmatimonadales bacterium]